MWLTVDHNNVAKPIYYFKQTEQFLIEKKSIE